FQVNLQSVMEHGNPEIWEPFSYTIDGEEHLITSIVYPILINEQVVGVTGVHMPLEKIDEVVREFTFYESGFAGLITANGNVIAHQNRDLIGGNYYEAPAMIDHPEKDQVIIDIIEFKQILIEGNSDVANNQMYRMFTP